MSSENTLRRFKENLDEEEAIETTFQRLRREGHTRQEAVEIILDVLDVSLREAKEVLLTSKTWGEAYAEADDGPPAGSSDDVPPPAPG